MNIIVHKVSERILCNKYPSLVGAIMLYMCLVYNSDNILLGQVSVQHTKLFFPRFEFIGLSGMDKAADKSTSSLAS